MVGAIPLSERVSKLTSKINELHANIEKTKQEKVEEWDGRAL